MYCGISGVAVLAILLSAGDVFAQMPAANPYLDDNVQTGVEVSDPEASDIPPDEQVGPSEQTVPTAPQPVPAAPAVDPNSPMAPHGTVATPPPASPPTPAAPYDASNGTAGPADTAPAAPPAEGFQPPPPAGETVAPPVEEENNLPFTSVALQGLNKVTAHISTLHAPLGEVTRFGNLEIVARSCWQAPPDAQPENAVYLEIWERKIDEAPARIFTGWMFSSSPALSSLEHPFYDITVLKCERQEVTDEIPKKEQPAAKNEQPAAPSPAPADEPPSAD